MPRKGKRKIKKILTTYCEMRVDFRICKITKLWTKMYRN